MRLAGGFLLAFAGGLMIGLAGSIYLLVNGRIMGVSGILGGLISGGGPSSASERIAFLAALCAAPAAAVWLTQGGGETNITSSLPVLLAGGFFVGLGTRLSGGCTSGHGVCGISRLSPRGLTATATFILAGALAMALGRHALGLF